MPPILVDNFSRPQDHLEEPVQHTRRIWRRERERRSRKRSTGRGAAEEEKGEEEEEEWEDEEKRGKGRHQWAPSWSVRPPPAACPPRCVYNILSSVL